MSATGNWRMELQEHPSYRDGHAARMLNQPGWRLGLVGQALTAWRLGWTDADDELRPRPGEQ